MTRRRLQFAELRRILEKTDAQSICSCQAKKDSYLARPAPAGPFFAVWSIKNALFGKIFFKKNFAKPARGRNTARDFQAGGERIATSWEHFTLTNRRAQT
jgi:hypothetical protein